MIARRKTITKKGRMWLFGLGVLAIATAVLVSVLVFASSSDVLFTATPYADVIRFQAAGVATLQVQIYDLSGKKVWDSGVVSGGIVDWDRNNDFGERLAYGAYIYSAQGWSAQGDLILQKKGKLALMPGDKVQLQAAPVTSLPQTNDVLAPFREEPFTFQPKAVNVDHSTESWAFGQIGIGTTSPICAVDVVASPVSGLETVQRWMVSDDSAAYFDVFNNTGASGVFAPTFRGSGSRSIDYGIGIIGEIPPALDVGSVAVVGIQARLNTNASISTRPVFSVRNLYNYLLLVAADGKIGIGTTNPTATLEVHGSATNLLALYDPLATTDPKFRVTKTGEVRADGAYYGASFNTGSADVAERINTSEWVEPGTIVEIDPDHSGFFRKARSPYSTKVAGIISTSPGVVLGNNFDVHADQWKDNRPVLAVTGRVPCKVSTENGPIEIGDLLVASSTPGVAMKGNPEEAMGAVVGKAMEPLEKRTGVIMVQVMLR